jgi:hypothetical protein
VVLDLEQAVVDGHSVGARTARTVMDHRVELAIPAR